MADDIGNRTVSESEIRYRQLRGCVADYHYHVLVENGRAVKKVHGLHSEDFTGYSAGEHVAHPRLWLEAVVEEDRATVERQSTLALSRSGTTSIEYRIRRKDGQIRWIRKVIVPYCDPNGQLVAYDSLLSDITDRKQAEEQILQSERRYQMLFEDDLTGDYVATPEGEILLCNSAFVKIFGFTDREQAIGSNLAILHQDSESWTDLIQRLRELQSIERYQRITRRNDGSVLHVIENIIGTFDEQGDLLRLKGYVYDDTQSSLEATKLKDKNVELEQAVLQRTRALRDKHHHLEAVLNSAFDAIITIDSQGIIQTVNLAADRIFGYQSTEMIGKNVKMLMPMPHRQSHDGYLQRYMKTGEKRILDNARELVACRKDGSEFPIELSVTEIDHSKVFTGIVHDISERKRLQRYILEIGAEEQRRIGLELHDGTGQELTGLALHAGTLLELFDAISKKSVDGISGVFADESRLVKMREFAEKLFRGLNEANHNVQQLAHGIMPVQIEPQGLQAALEELTASIANRCKLTCRFVCPAPIVVSNITVATHLYRIAQEALNNALRHSQANQIIISLEDFGDHVVLEVTDNGGGINLEPKPTPNTTERKGMGLRTIQYRCGMIGGTFHVGQLESGGTTVKCIVPISGGNFDE
ncbi:MAG: PAS domain S-box protein [Pirellulaceae bacterium]|nr:PAS domain S-box protein [Pirellulaceae bacterium]